MKFTRRRFLAISAAFTSVPATSQAQSWQGRALGADVSLTIQGPREEAAAALKETRVLISQVERLFSLYEPTSSLVALNETGLLLQPGTLFTQLMAAADHAYLQTDGLFDPTVQPLWAALAKGGDLTLAREAIGWDRVQFDAAKITLGRGQALTLNGIAQGFATDVVSEALMARGLNKALVNIGEYRGLGGPWTLGVEDPVHGLLGRRNLTNSAIATSSPAATPLGVDGHILHGTARPQWSSVSVEAASATIADSLSTAMVLASRDQIGAIKKKTDIRRVTLVDFDGNLTTL